MAYIATNEVKEIRNNLKKKFTAKDGWKFSVVREHYSSVRVAIMQSPKEYGFEGNKSVNHFYIKDTYTGKQEEALTEIYKIVSANHWDESDIMSDYFNCSFYITIQIGKWDKDCVISTK